MTYGYEVSLFVDEEIYKKAEIDAISMLCYNYKHSIFYYFD